MYFNKQARTKDIYDELEAKQREKLKKREEDMKRIEELERHITHLEANFKINEDLFNENHKVKVVDSEPFPDVFSNCYYNNNKSKKKKKKKKKIKKM